MPESTQEVQTYPTAWRPAPGDVVTGKLVNVEAIDPQGLGEYPVITLEKDGLVTAVHCLHRVLRTELAKRRPKIGDELTITYLGKTPLKNPRPGLSPEYHNYRVLGGSAPEYDWSKDLPEGEREDSAAPPIQAAEPFAAPVAAPSIQGTAQVELGDEPPF